VTRARNLNQNLQIGANPSLTNNRRKKVCGGVKPQAWLDGATRGVTRHTSTLQRCFEEYGYDTIASAMTVERRCLLTVCMMRYPAPDAAMMR